jgi:glycosyltransferase involved in cell wall biosynthesis
MKISIILPTFNRASILKETLKSIIDQSFKDFEILVWDDASTDSTEETVKKINDERIIYHKNAKNLGYGRNLQAAFENVKGDIVFLMGDDDILLPDALYKTHEAFLRGEHIGLVTRPYYWFWDDPKKPIRHIPLCDPDKDVELSIYDGRPSIEYLFRSAGQLSGLAFREKYMDVGFHEDVFTSHIYPFFSILKKYKAVYLKDFTVAVRTPLSMSTYMVDIYTIKSPTLNWLNMFNRLYAEENLSEIKKQCIDLLVNDTFNVFLTIKTVTKMNKYVINEMKVDAKYSQHIIYNPKFYFYGLIALLFPSGLLRSLINIYKTKFMPKAINKTVIKKIDDTFNQSDKGFQ